MTATIAAAGIDTWSPAWYVDRDSYAGGMLDELAIVPSARGQLLPEFIGGHRIGWNRSAGMLYAEGHPFGSDALVSPDRLPGAFEALCAQLVAAGVPLPPGVAYGGLYGEQGDGFAGVRRTDGTVTIASSSTAEGLAIAAGVAAIARDAPTGKAEVFFGQDGGVETVYFRGRGGAKVLGRWYDEGVQHGTAPRGRLIRAEDQRRYVKGTRRGVEELTAGYVRAQFQRRFYPLYQASKGVTVSGPLVLAEKLQAAVEAGELTARQAESLAGFLLLESVQRGQHAARLVDGELRRQRVSKATSYRRRQAARELGLVLADGVLQEVEVDLHDVLTQAMDSDAWGAEG